MFSILLSAQENPDSLELIQTMILPNVLRTSFEKQLNTFSLRGGLLFNSSINKLNLKVNEDYYSTFVRSTTKSIRDEQSLAILSTYLFSSDFSIGSEVISNIFSDSRKIEINQASVSNALFFSQYIPLEKIYLTPFLGYTNNRQIGENDSGPVYGIEGLADELAVDEFIFLSQLKFRNEDISPRKNTLRNLQLVITNYFQPEVSNSITAGFIQNRKDFYFTADSLVSQTFDVANNIQSRTESNYLIQDRLIYNNLYEDFSLDLLGRLNFKSIDRDTRYRLNTLQSSSVFDTRIEEFRIELESSAAYSSDTFDALLRATYAERDEKHLTKRFEGIDESFYLERSESESDKNNVSLRATVSLSSRWKISKRDYLSLNFFQSKLRYDTPSLDNDDDRDEILSILRLKYSRFINSLFETFITIEGTLSHVVYLFSERSSNNNLNRILALTTGGNYKGKNISSMNSFTVSANYTVYDFEDLNPNYRSFSYRQFTALDSSSVKIDKNLSLIFYGYAKLSEQGDLKWASFSTKPVRFNEELLAEPKASTQFAGFIFAAGARLFSLRTFKYDNEEKIIDSRYLSIGPICELTKSLGTDLFIRLTGWYEFITVNKVDQKEQTSLNLQMNWNF